MESSKILGAEILDILFDGRNKEYGAYELRKTYNGRLGRAMAVTGSLIAVLFLSGFVMGHGAKKVPPPAPVEDVTLTRVDQVKPPPPPPPPARLVAPQVRTRIYVTPRVVVDDRVETPPPVVDSLDHVRIGTVNTPGGADVGIAAPRPGDEGKGLVEAPKKDEDAPGDFVPVEKGSEYPGGPAAWLRYLNRNLRTPDEALENGITGTVVVKFVVDQEGNVSEVQAISGPETGGFREEAVRVIRKSGRWTPALQNGRYVKTIKLQPITFMTVPE